MSVRDQAPYVLLGTGGHAAVLIETLLAAGAPLPQLALDSDSSKHGTDFLGIPIEGGDELLAHLAQRSIRSFVLGVGSTKCTELRQRLADQAADAGLVPVSIVHPTALVSPSAMLSPGTHVLVRAIVQTNARLADHVLVNTGAIVEHDCHIGEFSHVATGAILAGGVKVGRGVHIGAGAVVRQGITIGDNAVIGMGAVVVKDVPPRTLVVGVPAR